MTIDSPSAPAAPDERPPTLATRVWRITVRVLLAALIGVGLGAAAYYGAPALYRQYIEPVRVNTERLAELEQAMTQAQGAARQQSEAAAARMAEIETSLAAQTEALAELRADVDGLQSGLTQQDRRLDTLEALSDRVDEVQSDLETTAGQIASLQGVDAPVQRLGRQLQMIRAMELLIRARLWLNQSNLGLAEDEMQTAQEILSDLAATSPADEAVTLAAIDARLDQALANLSRAPVVAADDLEIAWELLLGATAP
jgi:chromosome segregation ATPase